MSFGRDYIYKELKRLNESLEKQVQMYLIGGANMSLLGLKDATRDIDIIVDEIELPILKNALLRCEYVEKSLPIYQKMGSRLVMENTDGFRWDVFVNIVCHALVLSPSMRDRCKKLRFDFKNLEIFLLSKEDIFLFKGVTERERDIEDMHILYLQGLDFEVIKKEINWQSEYSGIAWITFLFPRLTKLQERYGIVLPNMKEIEKIAEEETALSIILEEIEHRNYTIEELSEELKESKSWVMALIKKLEERGKIKIKGNLVVKNL